MKPKKAKIRPSAEIHVPRRRKYDIDPVEKENAPNRAGFTKGELKRLLTLVRKYGLQSVLDAACEANELPPKKRGRPSRGLFPYYERMHMAQVIDEWAHQFRKKGNKTPVKDAEHDYLEFKLGDLNKFDAERIERARRTLKKERLIGRRGYKTLRRKIASFKRIWAAKKQPKAHELNPPSRSLLAH